MSQQINLLRDGLEVLELPWSARRAVLLAVVALVLALLWTAVVRWQLAARQTAATEQQQALESGQQQVLQLGQALNARQPDARLPMRIQAAREKLDGQRWILATLRGRSEGPSVARLSSHLEGLGRQRIDSLWLTDIVIDEGGAELALRGFVRQPEAVGDYLQRLGSEAAFAGREFHLFRLEPSPADSGPAQGALQFSLATRCGAPALEPVCRELERELPR